MRKPKTFTILMLMLIGLFGSANAATITYSIEEGATYEEFDGKITVTIEGSTDVSIDNYSYPYLYRTDEGDKDVMLASAPLEYNKDTNAISVTFPEYNLWPDFPVQTDGEYYILFLENSFFVDGVGNEETTIRFNIDSPEKFLTIDDVTIDPAPCDFEEIIPQFTITLPGDITSVEFNEVNAGASASMGTLTGKAQFGQIYGGTMAYPAGEYDITVEGNKLVLTPSSTLEASELREGEWGIRILRNSLYFNGDKTKFNDNIVFSPYVYPNFLQLQFKPESGSKIVDVSKFTANIDYIESDVVVDESLTSKLYFYNGETETYDYLCDLTTTVAIKTDSWGWKYAEVELVPSTTDELALGKYKIEMPKGILKTVDSVPVISAATTVKYEYIEVPKISLVPTWSIEEGSTVDKFTEVTMTFAEATQIAYVGEYDYTSYISVYQVVDGVATPWGGGSGVLEARVMGNSVKLYMSEDVFYPNYPIETDGDYRVVVPKGKFAFEGVNTYTNDELVLNFKVDAIEPPITQEMATIDPAPSAVKDMNKTFTITIEGVEGEISVAQVTKQEYDYGLQDFVEVTGPAKAELSVYAYGMQMPWGYFDISVEGNKVILTPDESLSLQTYWEYGDYTVALPKGALIVDNDPNNCNARLSFGPYTIEQLITFAFATPTEGKVESLSSFVLNSDAYFEPTTTDASLITISKYDDATEEYVVMDNAITTKVDIDKDKSECTFTLTLANEITEAGKYQLKVARNAFIWDVYYSSYTNDELIGNFEIVGAGSVEAIDLNNSIFNIYSLDGVLIKRNGKAVDLNNLDNGIYIINGQKVFINK